MHEDDEFADGWRQGLRGVKWAVLTIIALGAVYGISVLVHPFICWAKTGCIMP